MITDFRAVIDALPFGIHMYRIDGNGCLIFCGYNSSANKILGVDHERFMGKKIGDAFPQLLNTDVPDHYRESAANNKPWSMEQLSYDDQLIKGAFRVTAFQIKPGEMAAIFEDITLIKQYEAKQKQELGALTEQLAHSGRQAALAELTAGMAHELSQPLNGIKIIAQGLIRDIAKERLDPIALGEKLLSVVEQTTKMGGILQHMRVFSQGTIEPSASEVNALDIVNNALIFFEKQMIDVSINVIKKYCSESVMIHAVDIEVEQVVVNLLSNARYSLARCEKKERILTVSLDRRESMACISVEDNGGGMSPETVKKLFIPFFTTKQPGDGTGLSLSVSKKIVEKFGGRIEVDTKINEYARFTVLLPLSKI